MNFVHCVALHCVFVVFKYCRFLVRWRPSSSWRQIYRLQIILDLPNPDGKTYFSPCITWLYVCVPVLFARIIFFFFLHFLSLIAHFKDIFKNLFLKCLKTTRHGWCILLICVFQNVQTRRNPNLIKGNIAWHLAACCCNCQNKTVKHVNEHFCLSTYCRYILISAHDPTLLTSFVCNWEQPCGRNYIQSV